MSQIIYKGKQLKKNDAYGDGRVGKVVTLFEVERIKKMGNKNDKR